MTKRSRAVLLCFAALVWNPIASADGRTTRRTSPAFARAATTSRPRSTSSESTTSSFARPAHASSSSRSRTALALAGPRIPSEHTIVSEFPIAAARASTSRAVSLRAAALVRHDAGHYEQAALLFEGEASAWLRAADLEADAGSRTFAFMRSAHALADAATAHDDFERGDHVAKLALERAERAVYEGQRADSGRQGEALELSGTLAERVAGRLRTERGRFDALGLASSYFRRAALLADSGSDGRAQRMNWESARIDNHRAQLRSNFVHRLLAALGERGMRPDEVLVSVRDRGHVVLSHALREGMELSPAAFASSTLPRGAAEGILTALETMSLDALSDHQAAD